METERQYNWDDLEVGRFDLNHSERFFTRKHIKHEKIDEINIELLSIMDEIDSKNTCRMTKCNENKPSSTTKLSGSLESQRRRTPNGEKVTTETKVSTNQQRLPLVSKNHFMPPPSSCQTAPSVVKYKEIYEKKRQNALQRMLEEEKKKRMFKSKPAPNFASEPKPRKPIEALKPNTTPITPLVLKHSKEAEEKRKRWMEEYKKTNEPPKFVSRNPQVLYEEPFKPQKPEHHVEPQPFNLHTEKRLEERKQYDKLIKQKTEDRKRQVSEEEYERKRHEEHLVKEIRKMTTFKARPNPFK